MKPSLQQRAERVLDALDKRLEGQTFLPGADRPSAIAIVDRFHNHAGYFERRFLPCDDLDASALAKPLIGLRQILAQHREAVGGVA